MAKNIMVAPVGGNMDALFVGLREFPTERVVLIATEDTVKHAEQAKIDLEKFKIPAEIKLAQGNLWEEIFRIIGEIKRVETEHEIIINVASGDKATSCVATSAAFVNGLKAMEVEGNEAMLLPILKFSYYKMLTDKKMNILKIIYQDNECCASLEELSQKTKMSLPLISYHVNGNLKSEGLKELGLVKTTGEHGKTSIKLTTLGRMLVKGYV